MVYVSRLVSKVTVFFLTTFVSSLPLTVFPCTLLPPVYHWSGVRSVCHMPCTYHTFETVVVEVSLVLYFVGGH